MASPRRGRASSDATDGAPFRTGRAGTYRGGRRCRRAGCRPQVRRGVGPGGGDPTPSPVGGRGGRVRLSDAGRGPGRSAVGGAVERVRSVRSPRRGRAAGPRVVAARAGAAGSGRGASPVEGVPQRGGRVGRAGCRPQHLAPSACGQGWAGSARGCAVPGPGEFRSDGRGGVRGTGVARRGTRRRERRAGGPPLSMPPPSARGSERSPAGRRVRRRSRGGPCLCPRGRPGRS